MKIEIINSKLANKYFFISAISGCFDDYRKKKYDDLLALADTPLLSDEKNICKNHRDWFFEKKKTNKALSDKLISVFYSEITEKDAWNTIGNVVGDGERRLLQNTFESLDNKFQLFWPTFKYNIDINQKKQRKIWAGWEQK